MLFNNLTKKLCLIGLCMGMATSPLVYANNATVLNQDSLTTGAPTHGGTREGNQQYLTEAEGSQIVESQSTHYRITLKAGNPALGGTRESMHRDRVKIEGDKIMSQQVAQPEHNNVNAGLLSHGTRG